MKNKKKPFWKLILVAIIICIVITVWYYRWFPNNFKTSATNVNDVIQALTGFYATLFTAIAVIIGILAIIGWQWIKDLSKISEKIDAVEEKVKDLKKRGDLAEWAKSKVDKLGLSTFELKNIDKDDKEKLKEIEEYVISDLTDCGWLELFLAHKFMTKGKNFDKVENILQFIKSRDLLDENSKIHSFIYHFFGQLYSEKYFTNKKNELNYFGSENEKLRQPSEEERNMAIDLLKKSLDNYNDSIKYIELKKGQSTNEHDDRSYSNKAIVLLELYKFYRFRGKIDESNKCLEEAGELLDKKIREKDYNTYYDLSRVYFYKGDRTKFLKCLNEFKTNIELYEKKERYELKKIHLKYMEEEREEFKREGFPGKNFDIHEFFVNTQTITQREWARFKRNILKKFI